ncbi:hypothetical protein [Pseudomonas citronellolis]|uniref:hypothetical protein n=1 Tax=Pseudomonas citronellolis TaxID=53408 RepID=UPI0018D687E2|nr:hypothetical protein [Pseudomonas citronellolis]MBH3432656.1 hypothetical protein [Pseudomonas citronellolis]
MKKSTYLTSPAIIQFVNWLATNLDNGTLSHRHINRKSGGIWNCGSLYDAYAQYHWPHPALPHLSRPKGASFAHNAATLSALRGNLQNALHPAPNDSAACIAAIDVMTWGGVRAGNVRWLRANTQGLAKLLIDTRDALNTNDTSHPRLTNPNLRFNSGMSKVYSLICESLIIYDSRVAAALGWIVVRYCQATGLQQVPGELRLPWPPAKGASNPKQRNPSTGSFIFPALRSGALHAEWNLKASWLLEAVLSSPNAQSSKFVTSIPGGERLRALEAALFMIGYDLASHPAVGIPATAPAPASAGQAASLGAVSPAAGVIGTSGYDCYTLGKGTLFQYRIHPECIDVGKGNILPVRDINATLTWLWHHFSDSPFPLANSATEVPKGTAPIGMGTAYFQATGKPAPHTSRLAAVLEELDIIIPCSSALARGLHWTLNTQLLGLKDASSRVDVSPILEDFLALEDED